MISSTPQPTWLLESDPRKTFDDAEASAAALAATLRTAGPPSPLAPTQQPPNPSTCRTSYSHHCFATPPSIPQINSSTFAHAHYQVKIPMFYSALCSTTSLTSTEMSTRTFAEILAAQLTTKCLTVHTTPPMKRTTRRATCQASSRPPSLPTALPLRKSRHLQMLPPPSMPPSSAASPSTNTRQSCLRRLRPSSPSIQPSAPPSVPPPMASQAPFGSAPSNTPNASQRQDSASSNSSGSTTNATPTTDSCKLDWAYSAFPMALSVTREESPPES